MKFALTTSVLSSMLALTLLCGCQSDKHAMAQSTAGKTPVCKSCYEQITRVQQSHRRTGPTTQTLYKHVCADCNAELTVYSEGGVLKAKCAHCAPDGVACDLCAPKADAK